MNILAVDTTTKNANVSLKKGNTIFSKNINNEITHSEKLLPLIDDILTKNDLKVNDINKFALINGPGSFTGIRIGLATIKAFSHVLNTEIFSISSLELIAATVYQDISYASTKYVLSFIDAKNERVYYALYKVNLEDDKLKLECVTDIKNDIISDGINFLKDFCDKNSINYNDIIMAGILSEDEKRYLNTSNFISLYPSTENLLNVMNKLKNIENYSFNAFSLKAIYARPSQAERVKNGEK